MKKIAVLGFLLIGIFLFSGCSTTTNSEGNEQDIEVTTSASVSENTGKWVEKELNTVGMEIDTLSESTLSEPTKTSWSDVSLTLKKDLEKEQISDSLKAKLSTFKQELEKDIGNADAPTKKQLESINTTLAGVLEKLN